MKTSPAFFTLLAAVTLVTSISIAAGKKSEPVKLTSSNFAANTSEGVVLIDFWAAWCGPCQMIAPVIDELADKYEGKAVIAKVNVDSNPDLAQAFRIQALPNLKIMKDGKVVDEIVGFADKKYIEKKLKKHLR